MRGRGGEREGRGARREKKGTGKGAGEGRLGGQTEESSRGLTLVEDVPKAEVGTLHTSVLCHFTDEETEAEIWILSYIL